METAAAEGLVVPCWVGCAWLCLVLGLERWRGLYSDSAEIKSSFACCMNWSNCNVVTVNGMQEGCFYGWDVEIGLAIHISSRFELCDLKTNKQKNHGSILLIHLFSSYYICLLLPFWSVLYLYIALTQYSHNLTYVEVRTLKDSSVKILHNSDIPKKSLIKKAWIFPFHCGKTASKPKFKCRRYETVQN